MKKLLLACLGAMLMFSWTSCKEHEHDTFCMPAEWETHESIWVGWPTYENKAGWSTEETMAELVSILAPNVLVDLCVFDSSEAAYVRDYLINYGMSSTTVDTRVRFHNIEHNDWWFRDMGGLFLKNEDGELKVVDFDFNTWGYGPYANADPIAADAQVLEEGVDRAIAAELGLSTEKSTLILEGGALDFNGKGTVLISEAVTSQRMPNLSKSQIEHELKRVFRLKKVIWLDSYLGNDAHTVENSPYSVNGTPTYTLMATNGHVDEFVRFVNSNTVLLCAPPSEQEALNNPIAAQSRAALLSARAILEAETDQDGNPIQIIELPEPPLMYTSLTDGDGSFDYITLLDFTQVSKPMVTPGSSIQGVWAASYMNYLVTNGLVIVPRYADYDPSAAASDALAVSILQAAFPGRQVVSMDVRAINIGGGGIHCITQQMPTH